MSGEEPAPGPALRTAPPTSYPADHLVALGLLLALAGFLGVGIAYGTILGPISIAFNDPLHTNPVTSAGKALMREAGPLQFLAALAALLLLSVSVVLKARARHLGLGIALVPSLYVVGYMFLEAGQFTPESAPVHHGETAPARYGQTAPRGAGQQGQLTFPCDAYCNLSGCQSQN